ncbi:hypothetical protein Naga_100574g2 [Nannochloropsis gaditana]|uniref:Uncharacterized protein n=1 Tax=Nannochloropsis gaditana TaxID=72520 RepID=W7T198_9STRA|nr:hypothetical protein Naga_100574g2 [Nannochloropsis gaditana]
MMVIASGKSEPCINQLLDSTNNVQIDVRMEIMGSLLGKSLIRDQPTEYFRPLEMTMNCVQLGKTLSRIISYCLAYTSREH